MLLGPAGNSFPMPEFRSNGWICIPSSICGASLLCTGNNTIYITIYTIPWRLPGENTLRAAASVDPPVYWLIDDWLAERLSRKDDKQNAAAPDVPFCSLSSHVKLLAACLLYIPTSQLHLGALAPHQTLFFSPNARWKSSLSSSLARPCAAGAAVRTPPDTWRKTQQDFYHSLRQAAHLFFFYSSSFPSSSFISLPSSPLPCQTAGYCVWLGPPKDDFQIDKVTTAAITRGGRCRTFPCLRIWSQWTPCSRVVTLLQQVV